MSQIYEKQGGAAFPLETKFSTDFGMSLRDYFAGQALAGLCANSELTSHFDSPRACWAYKLADAMLKARKEQL